MIIFIVLQIFLFVLVYGRLPEPIIEPCVDYEVSRRDEKDDNDQLLRMFSSHLKHQNGRPIDFSANLTSCRL